MMARFLIHFLSLSAPFPPLRGTAGHREKDTALPHMFSKETCSMRSLQLHPIYTNTWQAQPLPTCQLRRRAAVNSHGNLREGFIPTVLALFLLNTSLRAYRRRRRRRRRRKKHETGQLGFPVAV
ncbi:hypothetical protein D4764_02G0004990 [Takifugu flavidus]|uniref:Secreted protein n=1 Tax=Takifugu flavidus TaxID=433684 RepID=A0A5C6NL46_9TELE|nr:hypothetical protein D4764_02G0004990 [Takifugu flavidus]